MAVMDLIFGDVHYTLGFGNKNAFLGIAGNLCGKNAERLRHAFAKIAQRLKGRLFVSLDGLKTLDSLAIALFLQQKKVLAALNCEIVLVDVPEPILLILNKTDLNSVFEILPTRQEAELKYGYALN